MTGKTGREAAVSGLQAYRSELLVEQERIQSDLAAVDRSIELLIGTAIAKQQPNEHSQPSSQEVGPQEMVVRFLSKNPGRFFKPSELARLIRISGYHLANPKTWPTQVTTCLKRAVVKGFAELREDADGKKRYGLKQAGVSQ